MAHAPDEAEVIVVGAGIAGCAVALHLARLGHDVSLFDRARFPRAKVCGEGLMPHGVDAMQRLGVALPAGAQPFVGVAWSADDVRAVGTFPGGAVGYGVARTALDDAFLRSAGAHPRIRVRTSTSVTGVSVSASGVVVTTQQGEVRGRALVGADGLRSRVRRWLGLHREASGRRRFGVRGHFLLDSAAVCPDRVEVVLTEGGEIYLTPLGGRLVNVAVLCEAPVAASWRGDLNGGLLRAVAGSPQTRALLAGAEQVDGAAAVGPLRQVASALVADRALLVGDAGGFVDGITGEGMSLALLSAEIAAQELSVGLRRGRLDRASLSAYARRRARIATDLTRLTELVLWGIRHRTLARRVLVGLARRPDLFDRLLAVDTARAPVRSLLPVLGALLS